MAVQGRRWTHLHTQTRLGVGGGGLMILCVGTEIKRRGLKAADRRGLSGVITSHTYIGFTAKAICRFSDVD